MSVFVEALEGNKKRKTNNDIEHLLRFASSVRCHPFMIHVQPYARTSMLCTTCIRRRVRCNSHLRFFFLKRAGVHASPSNIEVRTLCRYVVRSFVVASRVCSVRNELTNDFAFFVSFEGCRFLS